MTIRLFKILLAVIAVNVSLAADAASRGFAVFVDSISHSKAGAELKAYAGSIDRQGLKSEIVVINSNVSPDSIRSIIRRMASRKDSPIEGMVFVGDIPVPMLLDAQHFSSAFKAVQNPKRLAQSSIPSDRFYDDLDLKFDFLSRDTQKPLLYYYSLRSDSPQKVAPDLYSGRIKSIDFYGKDKYENLRDYLKKVVKVKNRNEEFQQMLLFSGQGYNSESITARIDEVGNMYEHFPWMKQQSSSLSYLDHRQMNPAKYAIMSALQQPNTSLALMHHHGSPDKEFINRYPDARSVTTQLEEAKRFFRSKIRAAVDRGEPVDSAVARYAKMYDVPEKWFADVIEKSSVDADSIYDYNLDLHLEDFGKYVPNSRIVILDACFNGSFNNDEYIAGAYIFGDGDCVVAIGNSVNSLQDKWADKNIGLLGEGLRVGNISKYNPYLEMHVIGDPTFAFAPKSNLGFDINKAVADAPLSFWKKQIAKSPYPSVKALALQKLYEAGAYTPVQVLDCFKSSDSPIVRHAALMLLSSTPGDEFVEAIRLGISDSNEIVRRFSAIFAGKNGSPSLIPALIKAYANPLKGERVNFQEQMALCLFDYELLVKELENSRPYRNSYNEAELMEKAKKDFASSYSNKKYEDELANLASDKPDEKKARQFIRQLRNNPLHPSVDSIFAYLDRCENEDMIVTLVEALGWFNYSYRAPEVADKMNMIADNPKYSDRIRKEAKKSALRLGSSAVK